MTDGDRKFAFVTGTSSGVGAATARALVARGWHVAGLARRDAPFVDARYEHIVADLGDLVTLRQTVAPRIVERLEETGWSRVGLVNNAALPGLLGRIEQMDLDAMPEVLTVNVIAPMWAMGLFTRPAPESAPLRIVNVSTGAATRGFAGLGAYGASKAALRMAGMVLAAELDVSSEHRSQDVRILSYEPGTVDTPMQAHARTRSRETLPTVEMFLGFAARGSLVPPTEPASEIVEFLESGSGDVFQERRLHAR
ncbi:MAG TPA: SDR family NAD(P)-dependent oxidoreductase [Gemmatimonadaceae bacterium]